MVNLEKFHLPYRDDTAFSLLAFCIFLVPLAFSLYSYENFESVKFALFLIFTGASAIAFFIREREVNNQRSNHKYFLGLLSAFGLWAGLSALFAQDKLYAFLGFYYRYTSGLVFYAALLLFIWLLIKLLDQERLKYLLKILVVDALAISVVTYLQGFGWIFYGGLDQDGIFHGPSLLGNPNYSAMFLACLLPLALYLFVQAQKFRAKVYYAVAAFLIILSCVLLASRGALLGILAETLAAMIFLAIFRFPKKVFWSLFLALGIFSVAGYFVLHVSRPGAISTIVGAVDSNTITRFYAWEVSAKEIYRHPWFGSGPGNFALFFERNRPADLSNQVGVFDDAHNLYLHLAATGGLPLLLIFLAMILLAARAAIKNLYQTKDFLPLALLCALVSWLVAVSFNPVPIPMFLLLAVLLAGLTLAERRQPSGNPSGWQKWPAAFLALALMCWGLMNLASEHLLGLSRSAYNDGNFAQARVLAGASGRLNPSNSLYLNYRAASEINLGQDGAGVNRDIQNIINLHPAQASSFVSASNLYQTLYLKALEQTNLASAKANLTLAISNIKAAIAIDPLFGDRYGQLGLLYYQAGDYPGSLASVEKNLSLNDGNFSAWMLLAQLYRLQGKKSSAVRALTKAYNINPDNRQLKYILELAKNLPDIKQVPLDIKASQPGI